ncbi:MAG: hypothetical protein WC707_02155 [Candidatus Babeliaceae bacterium]|jgi:hypothetical protein
MEALHILEQKIAHLIESKRRDIDLIKELKDKNDILSQEVFQLKNHLEKVENSLLLGHQNLEELNQEKELTKIAVDDLIKSIVLLVDQELPQ